MMKNKNKIIGLLLTVLSLPILPALAQNPLRSAYFLEGYSYRHQMNPAFASERRYSAMPLLGNLNIGLQSNIGVSNFLYKHPNGGLTTFLNENVSSSEFLDGLKNRNRLNMDLGIGIFSTGFWAWNGFNTLDISLKSNSKINLPYDLFAFMKEGMTSGHTVYNMKDLGIHSNNYMEIALGHSHKVNEKLNVGAKIKFLVGLYNTDMNIKDMNVTLSDEKWMVSAQGEFTSSGLIDIPTKKESGASYETEQEGNELDFENIDVNTSNIVGGFGLAFDFGATYQLRDDLQLSAALLDLGFINWKKTLKAQMSMEPWEFDGFHNIAVNPDENDPNGNKPIEDQIDDLTDDLEEYFTFQSEGESGKSRMLGATLNLGALYTLPYYDKLKFGFLSSTRIQGKYSWSEGRFSANVAPISFFDASVNYAISSFGSSFGWVINFHPKGFNFFIGSNHQFFKVTPQFVPVHHANADISLGFNFPLGKCRKL